MQIFRLVAGGGVFLELNFAKYLRRKKKEVLLKVNNILAQKLMNKGGWYWVRQNAVPTYFHRQNADSIKKL